MVKSEKKNRLSGNGLIFAPDLIEFDAAVRIINDCLPYLAAIKIGNTFLYKYGINIIRKFKNRFNLPIICDLKLMDIPDIAEKLISLGVEEGMDGAMIWGIAGYDTIAQCTHRFPDLMLFVLTEFTHTSEYIDETISNNIAVQAKEIGVYGLQAPATKPQRIAKLRKIVGKDLVIISCGIGHQGPRFGTAINQGANYEIIGRAIYADNKPAQIAKYALDEITKASLKN